MNNVELTGSAFVDTKFYECTLQGINWTKLRWPQVALSSPVEFHQCNLSYSSFFGLALAELVLDACKCHEVDFREGEFTRAYFTGTDFEKSLFNRSNLSAADFTDAVNYAISPLDNNVTKARFSLPDAMVMLKYFDVVISD